METQMDARQPGHHTWNPALEAEAGEALNSASTPEANSIVSEALYQILAAILRLGGKKIIELVTGSSSSNFIKQSKSLTV